MTPSQINALIASAFNLHIGTVQRGDFMTPTKAANLPREDRINLCNLLAEKGGSDLYSQEQARAAAALI